MADDNEIAASVRLACAHGLWRMLDLLRQIVLRNRLQHGEELPAAGGDFPAIVAAQHVAVAENVNEGNAGCKPPDPRAPLGAAGRENRDIPIERGNRRAATAVTRQNLQYRNLYAQQTPRTATVLVFLRSQKGVKSIFLSARASSRTGSYPRI